MLEMNFISTNTVPTVNMLLVYYNKKVKAKYLVLIWLHDLMVHE